MSLPTETGVLVSVESVGTGSPRALVASLHGGAGTGPRPEWQGFASAPAVLARRAGFARALAEGLGSARLGSIEWDPALVDLDRPPAAAVTPELWARSTPETRRSLLGGYLRATLEALARIRATAPLTLYVVESAEKRVELAWSCGSRAEAAGLDPLVHPVIAERLADPYLMAALAERSYPEGPLRPGCYALRAAARDWLSFLQAELESRGRGRGEALHDSGRKLWCALLDVHGLDAETHWVQSYLHGGTGPGEDAHLLARIGEEYRRLGSWVRERQPELLERYWSRPGRCDGIVVRIPEAVEVEEGRRLGHALAEELERLDAARSGLL